MQYNIVQQYILAVYSTVFGMVRYFVLLLVLVAQERSMLLHHHIGRLRAALPESRTCVHG